MDGLAFEIELKRADIEFVEQVLSEVDDAGAVQGAEFTSSFLGALVHLGRSAPSATLGNFARRPPEGTHLGAYRPLLVEDCLALQLDVLHAPLDLLDEALVNLCHLSGLRVHAANVDEPADLLAAAELGVDQLSTNRCDLAVQVLKWLTGSAPALVERPTSRCSAGPCPSRLA